MIVFKEHIDSRITDRGIFYCSITISFGEKKKSEKIVYSRYMHEKCISPFIDKNILDSIGVKKNKLKTDSSYKARSNKFFIECSHRHL